MVTCRYLNRRKMSIPDTPMSPGAESLGPEGKHKIFVGGLSWTTNEDALRAHFSTFGSIDEVMIMRDKATGRSRGFAFVTFKDGDSVDRALQSPHHQLDGRQIEAKRAIPKAEIASKTKKIFVGGVPHTVNDEQFREYFSRFGEIVEALIMRDRNTGKSRGFGFVTFANEDSVDKVFAVGPLQMQGKNVEVKKAEPKRPATTHSSSQGSMSMASPFPGAPAGSAAFPVFYAAPFPYAAPAFASPYATAPGQAAQLTADDQAAFLPTVLQATSPPHAFFSFTPQSSSAAPTALVPGTAIVSFGSPFAHQATAPHSAPASAPAPAPSIPNAISALGNVSRTARVSSIQPLSAQGFLHESQQRRQPQQQPMQTASTGSTKLQTPLNPALGAGRTYPSPIGHPPRSPNINPTLGHSLLNPSGPGVDGRFQSPNAPLHQMLPSESEEFHQAAYAAVRRTI